MGQVEKGNSMEEMELKEKWNFWNLYKLLFCLKEEFLHRMDCLEGKMVPKVLIYFLIKRKINLLIWEVKTRLIQMQVIEL